MCWSPMWLGWERHGTETLAAQGLVLLQESTSPQPSGLPRQTSLSSLGAEGRSRHPLCATPITTLLHSVGTPAPKVELLESGVMGVSWDRSCEVRGAPCDAGRKLEDLSPKQNRKRFPEGPAGVGLSLWLPWLPLRPIHPASFFCHLGPVVSSPQGQPDASSSGVGALFTTQPSPHPHAYSQALTTHFLLPASPSSFRWAPLCFTQF